MRDKTSKYLLPPIITLRLNSKERELLGEILGPHPAHGDRSELIKHCIVLHAPEVALHLAESAYAKAKADVEVFRAATAARKAGQPGQSR